MADSPISRCTFCGIERAPSLRACPACGTLVHRQRLRELAAEAAAAQERGDAPSALAAWRSVLEFVPENSQQYQQVAARIDALSREVDRLPASARQRSHGRGGAGAALGVLGTLGLLAWKFKAIAVLLLTKGKLLLLGLTKGSTLLSMFASMGVYWSIWGWKFAIGLVVSIYIHEMGHVAALRRLGLKANAPMFIPGLGAVILMKQYPQTPREDARVGLAGPMWGLGAAAAALAVFLLGGGPFWGAIASVGAWINIFNLMPVWQLDGARGFRALLRWQRWTLVATIFGCWLGLHEIGVHYGGRSDGMLLLVGIVALGRALLDKPPDTGDAKSFAQFLFLVVALSAIASVRVLEDGL